MSEPLVSICCITFNHAKYIRKSIEGFLSQKTDFTFEILIHDDASTDGTSEIIMEYQKNYPGLIKPIIQHENQYSRGVRGINFKYNFPRAKGKYIALCEGDDYWVDPLKLQKQVHFLEANSEYCMCSGYADTLDEMTNNLHPYPVEKIKAKTIELVDVILANKFITHTVVFKNNFSFDELAKFNFKSPIGDWHLYVTIGKNNDGAKYFIMPERFGVYRVHQGGVYSTLSQEKVKKNKYIAATEINELTGRRYSYLFLLNDLITRKNNFCNSELIIHLISEVQCSFLKKEIKELIIGNITSQEISPDKILKNSKTNEEFFAISIYTTAASYILSNNRLPQFARQINQILKIVNNQSDVSKVRILNYLRFMWRELYPTFNYKFKDVLMVLTNKHLFHTMKEIMDWLYNQKKNYPILSIASSIKRKLN